MSISVTWEDTDQTVLRFTVAGAWTWDEFYAAISDARALADSAETDHIDSIIDILDSSLFPSNVLFHARRLPSGAHPKLKSGTLVMVGSSPLVKTLLNIMRQLNPKAMRNFYITRSIKEAEQLLSALHTEAQIAV